MRQHLAIEEIKKSFAQFLQAIEDTLSHGKEQDWIRSLQNRCMEEINGYLQKQGVINGSITLHNPIVSPKKLAAQRVEGIQLLHDLDSAIEQYVKTARSADTSELVDKRQQLLNAVETAAYDINARAQPQRGPASQTKIQEIRSGHYRKTLDDIIQAGIDHYHQLLKQKDYAVNAEELVSIKNNAKMRCKSQMAVELSYILEHDPELKLFYNGAMIQYSNAKGFYITSRAEWERENARLHTQPTNAPLDEEQLLEQIPETWTKGQDVDGRLQNALDNLNATMDADLNYAFREINKKHHRYFSRSANDRAGGAALTFLAVAAEAGVIAGTVVLFMQEEQTYDMFLQLTHQIDNFWDYVKSQGKSANLVFTDKFYGLDTGTQEAIRHAVHMYNQAGGQLLGGIMLVMVIAGLLVLTACIYSKAQEHSDKAIHAQIRRDIQSIEPQVENGKALFGQMIDKLDGFTRALSTEAKKEIAVEVQRN